MGRHWHDARGSLELMGAEALPIYRKGVGMSYSVRVPRVFYGDHEGRCITREVVARSTSKGLTIELEGHEVANLLSDADYWATEWPELGQVEGFGLGSSARATAAAIRKQFDAATLEGFRIEWREIEAVHHG